MFTLATPAATAAAFAASGLADVRIADVVEQSGLSGAVMWTATAGADSLRIVETPTTGSVAVDAGRFVAFGIKDRTVVSSLDATFTAGTSTSGVLEVTATGALPLMDQLRPVARGGAVAGYGLSFARIPTS